ncbi:hypothetical protein [Corynebacterium ammoniagenes]|uniref:Tat pathway signal sequence domain protein n=1 Tax=Corynebacterium ammoniagenes DSM 20306 TaxID=649754 RepID=A0ABN0AF64_CORAM|nr:hypothetical protein [Corynebacterium ammoniagenes]APT83478.1 membrane protein [Corynebacterium ammoniagenes DSM 20306]EFG81362.1 hypothetical protein HMPREF0281_01535 [Corynebacterium ammoniagenes DSM 20306]
MAGQRDVQLVNEDFPSAESTDPGSQDHWLDEVTEPSNPVFNPATQFALSTFAGPARIIRRIWNFMTTTPGRMFAITVALSLAIAAAGVSMSNSSAERQGDLDRLLTVTEPTANAAHNLYTSLSLADTVASTGFVQGGVESSQSRQKYNEAIDRAAVSATQAVQGAGTDDHEIRQLVRFIQRELPVYTGMVENARANHRMSNAVSAAYMSNASAIMREEILPAASRLFTITSSRVADEQRSLTAPQWVPLSGLLAAVIFLLLAQWWLWRITRRRLNRGFVTATSLMALAIIWVSLANIATWTAGSQAFDEASSPWSSLTTSRIAAQQARTTETLALVRRDSEEDSVSFSQVESSIREALDEFETTTPITTDSEELTSTQVAINTARESLDEWSTSHEAFVSALRTGRYDAALHLATAPNPDASEEATAASAFNALDNALTKLIADSRETMRAYISDGLAAMTFVASAVMVLTVLAIFAVWLGIRPRLQEYL